MLNMPKWDDSVIGVLMRAADVIETGGLARNEFQRGRAHCIRGAIHVAMGQDSFDADKTLCGIGAQAMELVASHIGANPNFCAISEVVDWNNADGRTAEQVTRALRGAAYLATIGTDINA